MERLPKRLRCHAKASNINGGFVLSTEVVNSHPVYENSEAGTALWWPGGAWTLATAPGSSRYYHKAAPSDCLAPTGLGRQPTGHPRTPTDVVRQRHLNCYVFE